MRKKIMGGEANRRVTVPRTHTNEKNTDTLLAKEQIQGFMHSCAKSSPSQSAIRTNQSQGKYYRPIRWLQNRWDWG